MVYEIFIELLKEGHKKALEAVRLTKEEIRKVLREELREELTSIDLSANLRYTSGPDGIAVRDGKVYIAGSSLDGYPIILVSEDRGKTWEELYKHPYADGERMFRTLHFTRKGTLIATLHNGTLSGIVRSEDLKKFDLVFSSTIPIAWVAEDGDGRLYTDCGMDLTRSLDDGKTWAIWISLPTDDHIHHMIYDKFRERIMVITGDTAYMILDVTLDGVVTVMRRGCAYTGIYPIRIGGMEVIVYLLGTDIGLNSVTINPADFTEEKFLLNTFSHRITDFDLGYFPVDFIRPIYKDGHIIYCPTNDGALYWTPNLTDWYVIRGLEGSLGLAFDDYFIYIVPEYGKTFYLIAKRFLRNLSEKIENPLWRIPTEERIQDDASRYTLDIESGIYFEMDFSKLMVHDGRDILSIIKADSSPVVTDVIWRGYSLFIDEYGIKPFTVKGTPTYITYGGLDRAPVPAPELPVRLVTYEWRRGFGNYQFTSYRCDLLVQFFIAHIDYVNRLMQRFGTTAVTGGTWWIRQELHRVDSYSSDAGVETTISEVDLGKVFWIRKLCVWFDAYIATATPGSFVKVYTSEDGVTYTERYSTGDLPTTSTRFYAVARKFNARYIRITINSAAAGVFAYCDVRPSFAWSSRHEWRKG